MEQQVAYLQTKLVVLEKENQLLRKDVHILDGLENFTLEQLNDRIGKSVENLSNLRKEFDERVAKKPIDLCLVCSTNPKNILILDCRHLCVCEICSNDLSKCPKCQARVTKTIKTFV